MTVPIIASFTTLENSVRDEQINMTKPTGVVEGDLLLCCLNSYGGVAVLSAPSGWTEVFDQSYATNTSMTLWYKKAGASEGTNYIWEFEELGRRTAWLARITGADADNPIDVLSTNGSGSISTATANGVTTVTGDTLVFRICGYAANGTGITTPPTEQWNLDNGYASSTELATSIEDGPASPGSVASADFTISGTSPVWSTYTVAIKSATEGGGSTILPFMMHMAG
jgi:hypothetical protein